MAQLKAVFICAGCLLDGIEYLLEFARDGYDVVVVGVYECSADAIDVARCARAPPRVTL